MLSPYPNLSYGMQNISVPSAYQARVCFIGQSNAPQASGYYTGLENYTISELETTFGANQHITKQLRAAIYELQSQAIKPSIHAYVKADSSVTPVSAIATLTLTGSATSTGTYSIIIDSSSTANICQAFFNVINGDSVTTVATAIVTAVTALSNAPVIATNTAGVLTLTSVNAGTVGNNTVQNIVISTIPGISVGYAMTPGSIDPNFSDIITQPEFISNKIDFFNVSSGYSALQSTLTTALYTRSTSLNNNLDYNGIMVIGTAQNTSSITPITKNAQGLNIVNVANKKLTGIVNGASNLVLASNDEISAMFCIEEAIKLTIGTNTASYLVNQTTGQPANASIPTANTSFLNLNSLFPANTWGSNEITAMQNAGYTILNINSGGNVIMGIAYTASNVPQFSLYQFRQSFFIVRYYFSTRIAIAYQQKSYTDGQPFNTNYFDLPQVRSDLEFWYNVLAGTIADSQDLTYYSGILQNAETNFQAFRSSVQRTLTFTNPIVAGVPQGTLTFSYLVTPTAPLDTIAITQQNNLIS